MSTTLDHLQEFCLADRIRAFEIGLPKTLLSLALVFGCLVFGALPVRTVAAPNYGTFGYTSASCLSPYTTSGDPSFGGSGVAAATATDGNIFLGQCGTNGSATASASADEASGQLKVLVQSAGNTSAAA